MSGSMGLGSLNCLDSLNGLNALDGLNDLGNLILYLTIQHTI